jgi:ubiquinone/menaquinone biosynthesis C-methylase UbiE
MENAKDQQPSTKAENDKGNVPNDNEKARLLVEQGYDQIALTYLNWTLTKTTPRLAYLEEMLSKMHSPSNAEVLELGCGAGVPGTQLLSSRCGKVVANDISKAQIELAKSRVGEKNVDFVQEDMTKLKFEPASFDAVVAFYSIFHLPRGEQAVIFQQIYSWLRPGGYLLCTLAASDNPAIMAKNWLGSEMYWSSFGVETNLKLLQDAGFAIDKHEILEDDEDGRLVPFLWIIAEKKE